jgi:hypothetical protein
MIHTFRARSHALDFAFYNDYIKRFKAGDLLTVIGTAVRIPKLR